MCAFPIQEGFTVKTFKNTLEGIGLFLQELEKSDHIVVEATGNYSSLLVYSLHETQFLVSVIKPKPLTYFFKMQLQINITIKNTTQAADYQAAEKNNM